MDFDDLKLELFEGKRNEMLWSCGVILKHGTDILLVRPKGASNTEWNFPKGKKEPGETWIDTAIRETYEEIGIKVPKILFKGLLPYYLDYDRPTDTDKTKRFYFYIMEISSLDILGLKGPNVPKKLLQEDEIQSARFINITAAKGMVDKKLLQVFDYIKY